MFGLEIIEVALGMAFAYFGISTICSGIVDFGVKLTKLRAKHLKESLGRMLADENYSGFVKDLYEHHLISSSLKDKLGDPTYIDAKDFSAAVFDILANATTEDARYKSIKERIEAIGDVKVRTRLLKILSSSASNVEDMRTKVEDWFNQAMSDSSEWYRKRMRSMVTLISFAVVITMNADTIRITKMLWNDNELRASTTAAASAFAEDYENRMADTLSTGDAIEDLGNALEGIKKNINDVKVLPVGWGSEITPWSDQWDPQDDKVLWFLLKIAGLLLTIGAVSMGSTYWYTLLKSLLKLKFGGDDSKKAEPTTIVVNTPTTVSDGGADVVTTTTTVPPPAPPVLTANPDAETVSTDTTPTDDNTETPPTPPAEPA